MSVVGILGDSFGEYEGYEIVNENGLYYICDREKKKYCKHTFGSLPAIKQALKRVNKDKSICLLCEIAERDKVDDLLSEVLHIIDKGENASELKEIGRGGAGIVYSWEKHKKYAFKLSFKMATCRIWGKEYEILTELKDTINREYPNFSKEIKYATINFHTDYRNQDSKCALQFPRIYHPDNQGYMIQTLWGEDDMKMFMRSRGDFLGIKQLSQYIPVEDMPKYIKDLGKILGVIHYIGRNDAYDIEVILGRLYEEKELKLFVIDFDLSEIIKKYDTETIDRMVWSLSAVNYFPMADSEFWGPFEEGYLEIAKTKNQEKIAIQVLDKYKQTN
jgi:tRNA A-37 threonylcarbamoyl transferase component Bud32